MLARAWRRATSPPPGDELLLRRGGHGLLSDGQARHTGKIVLRPSGNETVAAGPQAPAISSEGTYLITGGLGALGLETARYLTGKGARHLVLVGRRPPSAAAQQVVQQLRAAQAEISVRAVDVSRFDDVAALMAEISTSMPPLTGIVHTAGILDDGFLLQLDEERFRSVRPESGRRLAPAPCQPGHSA